MLQKSPMFELSIAFKYLTPRWRQLSVSIISLISILVIALVVWLIVVFFSVTYGLERNWIDRLIALTAPVRILPTDSYYTSYYYHVDSISSASGYAHKSIGEKRQAGKSDPYDSYQDEELPVIWAKPDLDAEGNLRDPVRALFAAIDQIRDVPGLKASDYEMTMANLRLQLLRQEGGSTQQASLSQATYLGSFDPENDALQGALLPVTQDDLNHLLSLSGLDTREEQAGIVPQDLFQERLQRFFSHVTIQALAPTEKNWVLPRNLLPQEALWKACALFKGERLVRILIPLQSKWFEQLASEPVEQGYRLVKGKLAIHEGALTFESLPVEAQIPLSLMGQLVFEATLDSQSIEKASRPRDLRFDVHFDLQGSAIRGQIPYGNLTIQRAEVKSGESNALWITREKGMYELPKEPLLGSGILLPRGFKDAGVLVGDSGGLIYALPTASGLQEQRLPVFVAGFYDPGIIPIGGKFVIADKSVTSLIRSAYNQDDLVQGNGVNVRFKDLSQADHVKDELEKAFQKAGIARYWKVETYREYDFTKDVIQQLKSEKNLFTLLATIIIVVACSNIISMLIILVNDKKLEIGILRSMGATSGSIALIFGTCGVVMGVMGSAIGILAAIFTLRHLQLLVDAISHVQGHDLFNPIYYGETLPSQLSWEAIGFVIVTTAFISLVSGLVPAIKASMMRPSAILKAE
ncbi:MAG: FtsX-like permease family protein [Parachlamydia sp.]|nr:FtsX-like permease family protein [Parachlamydia sp.]